MAGVYRWALSHLANDGQQRNTLTTPEFLDMVPWYSGYGCLALYNHRVAVTHVLCHFVSGWNSFNLLVLRNTFEPPKT